MGPHHAHIVGIALAAAGSFVWVNKFNAPKTESWKGGWPLEAANKQTHKNQPRVDGHGKWDVGEEVRMGWSARGIIIASIWATI